MQEPGVGGQAPSAWVRRILAALDQGWQTGSAPRLSAMLTCIACYGLTLPSQCPPPTSIHPKCTAATSETTDPPCCCTKCSDGFVPQCPASLPKGCNEPGGSGCGCKCLSKSEWVVSRTCCSQGSAPLLHDLSSMSRACLRLCLILGKWSACMHEGCGQPACNRATALKAMHRLICTSLGRASHLYETTPLTSASTCPDYAAAEVCSNTKCCPNADDACYSFAGKPACCPKGVLRGPAPCRTAGTTTS